jgi:hypothetical protein
MTDSKSTHITPRWVKIQGVFVVLLMLVVLTMSTGLVGGHGGHGYTAPSRNPASHGPSGGAQHMGGHR